MQNPGQREYQEKRKQREVLQAMYMTSVTRRQNMVLYNALKVDLSSI